MEVGAEEKGYKVVINIDATNIDLGFRDSAGAFDIFPECSRLQVIDHDIISTRLGQMIPAKAARVRQCPLPCA